MKKMRVKRLIFFYLFALFFLVLFTFYMLSPTSGEKWRAPGGIVSVDPLINVTKLVKSDVTPVASNLYMTYVSTIEARSRWQQVILHYQGYQQKSSTQAFNRINNETDLTQRDQEALEKILLPYMKHDILKAAMSYKNIEWSEKVSAPIVLFHPEHFETGKELVFGDEIISVDGEEIYSEGDINWLLQDKSIGDPVEITLIRNDTKLNLTLTIKELNNRGEATLGVYVNNRFTFEGLDEHEIIQLPPTYTGDSGAFMLALGVIQHLDPTLNLSRGRIIAGTGGVTRGGDIKEIADLDLKVLTASRDNVDVFIYPKFQEEVVTAAVHKYNINNLQLLGVRNLKEAIEMLSQ